MTAKLSPLQLPEVPFPVFLCWKVTDLGGLVLTPLYCVRTTEASVWPLRNTAARGDRPQWAEGSRTARRSSYEFIFDSFEDAHKFAVAQAQDVLDAVQRSVEAAKAELGRVRALTPPDSQPSLL